MELEQNPDKQLACICDNSTLYGCALHGKRNNVLWPTCKGNTAESYDMDPEDYLMCLFNSKCYPIPVASTQTEQVEVQATSDDLARYLG